MKNKWNIFAATIALCIVIALSGYLYYTAESTSITETNKREITTIAELKIAQLSQWYMDKNADARVISQSPVFRHGVERWLAHPNDASLTRSIREQLMVPKAEHEYDDILIASPEGNLLLSLDASMKRLNPITTSAIRHAGDAGDSTFSDFYLCTTDNKIFYYIISPVQNDKRHTIAFLVFHIDPNAYLYPLIESWPTPNKSSETQLVRRDNDSVLYLNELRFRKNSALMLRKSLKENDRTAVNAVLGYKGIFEGNDYRMVRVLAYIAPVPHTKWFLITKIDHSEIFAELYYRAEITGIISIISILCIGIGIAFYYRSRQIHIYRELFLKEQELRKYHEEFRAILYSIGDGVITTDLSGSVKQMNYTAAELTGWSETEAAGKHLEEVFTIINEGTRETVENPIIRVLNEGGVVGLANHTLLISKDGREIPIADSGAPICNEQGEIEGTVLVFRDKTEEHQAERTLQQSEEKYRTAEAKQRAMIANIADVIAIIEVDGTISYTSDNSEKIFGWKPGELCGRCYYDTVHPEDEKRVRYAFIELTEKENASTTIEYRYRTKDAGYRLVELSATNLVHNSMINGVLVNYHDITHRKQIEDKLRKLVRSVEQSPTSIVITDLKGDIEYVNPKFTELTGYTFEEVRGKNPRILKSGKTSPDEYRTLWTTVATGGEWHGEFQNKKKGGELYWEKASISPITNDAGAITHYLAVKEDVTDRKRLEQQLMQAQKLEGLGTLASGIAHEFNNLLAMILGSAELARQYSLNKPELIRYIDRIIEASVRGSSISRQLLVFSRPDLTEQKPISLSHIISEISDLLKHFLSKAIVIETAIDVDNGIIMGDSGQIHQALLNLALNAGDAMRNSGKLTIEEFSVAPEEIKKRFAVETSLSYLAVSVKDTGVGMDEQMIAKIFDPFFTTKGEGKGTGLGLAVVHGIVKNHGGFIDVRSFPGAGTTFTLYFPAITQPEEGPAEEGVVRPQMRNETILLVDDEESLREVLSEYLRGSGYRILSASNGADALDLFRTHHDSIDLVITDLGMPEIGGEELCRRLKKINAGVKVIVSSGYLDGLTKEHLLQVGVCGILKKPYRLNAIQTEILKVLEDC